MTEDPAPFGPGHEGGHREFLSAVIEDLKRRGLPDPLLVVTDGAPGLIRAVETCFPRALRQRWLAHRMRNLRAKVPDTAWPDVAIRARAC
jgi:transposase-like protein